MGVAGYPPPVDADGFTMSKWASECILEKAHAKLDIPIIIHRPTSIIGTNAPTTDMLTNLLYYSKELRAVPALHKIEGAFDMISIEIVARTIVRDAFQPIRGINFSNIGGIKSAPVKDMHLAMALDMGVEMKRVHLQEEIAHLFEVFDEVAKAFVYPDIKRGRNLA
jgi:thioester reductase-like protein